MKKFLLLACMGLSIFLVLALTTAFSDTTPDTGRASGEIVDGYRVVTIPNNAGKVQFTVFRGDYVKFRFDSSVEDPILVIPSLSIKERLPHDPANAPYFKMKHSGTVDFSLGAVAGRITVVEYRQERYRELTSKQAADFIKAHQPLILDVRTPGEYKAGHLKNARLIPIQALQGRLTELSAFKDREILVYCATGNRSTVASKILIDNGFKRISNLRHGVLQWSREKRAIVQ